jgi:putative ABC transport system permease protein
MPYRHAFRSLKRTPAFAITVILSLVLGIAATGSMFAIVHGVLLAPLPYGDPDRLVSVGLQGAEQREIAQPPAVRLLYERFARRIEAIGLYRTGNANVWSEDGHAERVTAAWMTASTMPLLRVRPMLGRTFVTDDERPGGTNAVILGEAMWRRRFGGAADVIGRTLTINSVPREIVGVMPAAFSFPDADTRVWLPVRPRSADTVGEFAYSGVARLAAGASAKQAQQELAAVLPQLAVAFPRLESGGATADWFHQLRPAPVVIPLRDEVTGGIARLLWVLAAAAGLVLLVAWANVVNLMLIRADSRQAELAVREALGASRLRTAGHFLGESVLLGGAAGALALPLTHAAVRALVAFGPADLPRIAELRIGPVTTGFVLLMSAISAGLCAAVPAFRGRRSRLGIGIGDGARGHTAGAPRQRLRAGVSALQIALALVVSIGSVLLLRTAHRLHDVPPGFDASDVTVLWTQLPFARYDDAAAVAFYARLAEQAARLPSVRAAGTTMRVPLVAGDALEQTVRVEGEARTLSLPVNVVDDGYFAAMRMPLLAGRGFQPLVRERGGDIVVSASAAAALFGDRSVAKAIGRRLQLAPSGPTYTIVGVVGDVRDRDLAAAPSALLYRPQAVPADPRLEPAARRTMALVVRSGVPPDALVPAIGQLVRELDPTVPIFNVEAMRDVVAASTARLSLALALMTAAAATTLLLGAVGLYGVMASMVALRTREFGVRLALGADPARIARRVVLHGLVLTACGAAAGFLMYALVAPFLQAFLYGVTTTDPATLAAAVLLLAAVASFASWLPARRAARVDPMVALRAE